MFFDIQTEEGEVMATDVRASDLLDEIDGARQALVERAEPRTPLVVYAVDEIEKDDGFNRVHGSMSANKVESVLMFSNERGLLQYMVY